MSALFFFLLWVAAVDCSAGQRKAASSCGNKPASGGRGLRLRGNKHWIFPYIQRVVSGSSETTKHGALNLDGKMKVLVFHTVLSYVMSVNRLLHHLEPCRGRDIGVGGVPPFYWSFQIDDQLLVRCHLHHWSPQNLASGILIDASRAACVTRTLDSIQSTCTKEDFSGVK